MPWTYIMGVGRVPRCSSPEDVEEDPDRWCSYTECGQELWQIACQWVWNLRHTTRKKDAGRGITRDRMGPTQQSRPSFCRFQNPYHKSMVRGNWPETEAEPMVKLPGRRMRGPRG